MKLIKLPLCLYITSLLFLCGCVAKGPTGTWQQSSDAKKTFESGTVLKDHTYYYTGSKAAPDAIIAVKNKYKLQSRIWAQINVTTKVMYDWLAWYKSDINLLCQRKGGYILTPNQENAGIWYSKYTLSSIRSPEPNVLEIYPPYPSPGSACDRQQIIDD